MRRTLLAVAGVAGVALLVAQAEARPGRGGHHPPFGDGAMKAVMAMMRGGDLSDAQRDQIRERLDAERESAQATREALREANAQLASQLLGGTAPDEATLRAALERIETLRAQLIEQHVETALSVRTLLSAEQLAAAASHAPSDGECDGPPPPPAD